MVYYIISKNELTHYGVKGMKWGVRHDPERVGFRRLKSKDGSNSTKKRRGLTNAQKIALGIGAAAAIAGVGYLAYRSGKLDHFLNVGKRAAIKQDVLGVSKPTNLPTSPSELRACAANVNPTGSSTNCGSVASAVIGNLKGGNYQALPEVPAHMRVEGGRGYDPQKLIKCYQGAKWDNVFAGNTVRETSDKLEQKIKSLGDGHVGMFYAQEMKGRTSSHYFSFKVVNNKVHVVEGQPVKEGLVFDNFYEGVGKLLGSNGEIMVADLTNTPVIKGREKDLFKIRS